MSGTSVEILKDSITDGGSRLTTWVLTYPRAIHAEVLTHGSLRRNSASSRAIPAEKLLNRTLADPFIPVSWGKNQKGMQADQELGLEEGIVAEALWRDALEGAAYFHRKGQDISLHKQIVNRIIEPWMMITVILSGTDFANFFHQRMHPAAEPNFQVLAKMMWEHYSSTMPEYLAPGEWHLPLIQPDEAALPLETKKKVATGRCARVSYLTHDGRRSIEEDVALHDRLAGTFGSSEPGHFSPFEHVAQAVGGRERIGPYEGWKQYRKFFPQEAGPSTQDKCERCGLWAGKHVTGCPRPAPFDRERHCPCKECAFLRTQKEQK